MEGSLSQRNKMMRDILRCYVIEIKKGQSQNIVYTVQSIRTMLANPSGGGLSQLVTKRRSSACCLLSNEETTLQKRVMFLSNELYPPEYRVFAFMSVISILPSDGPLIRYSR